MKSNVVNYNFKNHKNSYIEKRRRKVRIFAIIGAILMISGIVGSIFYYI